MMPLRRQQGFSLFIVMIIMLVIALLVVVTSQSVSTETRVSTNDADRKYALSMAESGLRDAEVLIQSFLDQAPRSVEFSYNCEQGLCLPLEQIYMGSNPNNSFFASRNNLPGNAAQQQVAWKRRFNNNLIWEDNARTRAGNNANVRYIVEYLGQNDHPYLHYNFRVTARAVGQNPNTVVMLQSTVELASR